MSTPVSFCWYSKAALGDEKAYQSFLEAMEYNLAHGAFTTFPCEHVPHCAEPTPAQAEALSDRLAKDLTERRQAKAALRPPPPESEFAKFISPVIKNMPPNHLKDLLK